DFRETKISSHHLLETSDQASEREMIESLTQPLREEYCKARVMLEEARIAENKQDYSTASEAYSLALKTLDAISKYSPLESERSEAAFHALIAGGFEVSARARVNASAGLLRKAESIFRRAKKLATSPDERLWASGHVHFCIALMASWRAIDGTA